MDDEPDLDILIQQRFKKQIEDGTYAFLFARDGEGALHQISKHKDITIVASDLNMPQMNGLELLSKIKKKHPSIKTMIVSAYSDSENIKLAQQEGAATFITKPINFAQFEQKIKTLANLTT